MAGRISLKAAGTSESLAVALDQLLAGNYPADARLDLLLAAAKRGEEPIKLKLTLVGQKR